MNSASNEIQKIILDKEQEDKEKEK